MRKLDDLRVAIIHDWLSTLGGAEHVLLALHQIFPKAPIYTSVYNEDELPQFKNAKIITSFVNNLPYGKKKPQIYLPFLPTVFENFDLSEFDLVISNCHCVSKGVITKPETMHISYCHAPIRYVWTPWLDPRLSGSFIKQKLASFLRVWDFQAAQRVDYFAANSFNIAQRIKKYYKKDADVIYPPVRTSLFKPDLSVKDLGDYYLLVGRLVSYKNPSIVIKAFNELGFKLKVIGTGPELSNLMKIAKGNIEFLGKVDDFELKKYYASSLAFVFPSEEDFGIVPVEAMASGRPVVAFRQGGATETIVEHVTGEFFDEPTTESLVDKLRVFNPMKYDSRVIQKRALEFDEEIFKKKFSEYVTIKINQ